MEERAQTGRAGWRTGRARPNAHREGRRAESGEEAPGGRVRRASGEPGFALSHFLLVADVLAGHRTSSHGRQTLNRRSSSPRSPSFARSRFVARLSHLKSVADPPSTERLCDSRCFERFRNSGSLLGRVQRGGCLGCRVLHRRRPPYSESRFRFSRRLAAECSSPRSACTVSSLPTPSPSRPSTSTLLLTRPLLSAVRCPRSSSTPDTRTRRSPK